jgi:thiaminase
MTAAELLFGAAPLWERIVRHPFVREAADGSLPETTFDRWIGADHFYVVGFRRFMAELVAVAPDEPARDLLAADFGALTTELELFRREAATRRIDLAEEPGPTTLGYTSFVQACVSDGFEVALAVLYGAEKAYFDAWLAVRESADESSPYWPFIDNWSSAAFGAWVDEIAGLLDRVSPAGPSAAQRTAFDRVVRFELRFWDAVYTDEGWPV